MTETYLWIGFILWVLYMDHQDWKYYKDYYTVHGGWFGSKTWKPWRLW